MTWIFPLPNKNVTISSDLMSFKNIDLNISTEIPIHPHCGSFGFRRKHHTHEGVDLYAIEGSPVIAVEDGTIVNIVPFTGSSINLPWWLDTFAILVEGKSGVVCYGEIYPDYEANGIKIGANIKAGKHLGYVMRVLREDKGRPVSMLHLELYSHGITEPINLPVNAIIGETALRDPTQYLIDSLKYDVDVDIDDVVASVINVVVLKPEIKVDYYAQKIDPIENWLADRDINYKKSRPRIQTVRFHFSNNNDAETFRMKWVK